MAIFIFKAPSLPFLSIRSTPHLPGFCVSGMHRLTNNLKKMFFPYLIPVFVGGGCGKPLHSHWLPASPLSTSGVLCKTVCGHEGGPQGSGLASSTWQGGSSPAAGASETTLWIRTPTCSSLPPKAKALVFCIDQISKDEGRSVKSFFHKHLLDVRRQERPKPKSSVFSMHPKDWCQTANYLSILARVSVPNEHMGPQPASRRRASCCQVSSLKALLIVTVFETA